MTKYRAKGLFVPAEDGGYRAENAIITGDVVLAEDVSIWFGCVLRGDDAQLRIGARTNIQDMTVVHADVGVPNQIGEGVTVGHGCVLHGAEIGAGCLIGMGAVLLSGCTIGTQSIVAAGSIVRENFQVPPRTLVAGVPARIVRKVTDEEVVSIRASVDGYVKKMQLYLD